MRIVIFDTDEQTIQMVRRIIEGASLELNVLSDVDASIALFCSDSELIDLAIISRETKDSEDAGFRLIQKMKNSPRSATIPVIAISDKLTSIDFAKHQKSQVGVNAYLRKPMTPDSLQKTIEAVLGKKIGKKEDLTVSKITKTASKGLVLFPEDGIQSSPSSVSISYPQIPEESLKSAEIPLEDKIDAVPISAPADGSEQGVQLSTYSDKLEIQIKNESVTSSEPALEEIKISPETLQESLITTSVQSPVEIVAPPTPPAPPVEEVVVEQDLPYLFGGGLGGTALQNVSIDRSKSISSTIAGDATPSSDLETLKKYLMMREQDAAILSAQLTYAKEELEKSEQTIKRLTLREEDLNHQIDDRNQRIEKFEQELAHVDKSKDGEIEQLRFDARSKGDRVKFLEDQLANSSSQYEKLKDRVRQDIRKIRVREKELENKLEILKKDSETLIAARESKILELKRKIDLLEFNFDTLQDQNEKEKSNVAQAHEKIAKVVKVLKLAMGIIEGESEAHKDSENESKESVA